jgi:hypothetical protein
VNDFIRSVAKASVIVGDFNYPNINWETMIARSHAMDFVEALSESFLTQHVMFPTHKCGNTLDLVLSNMPNLVSNIADCGVLGNSDHSMICTELDMPFTAHAPKHVVWNYKQASFEEMRSALKKIQWSDILVSDVETDWNTFKDTLLALCDKFIPKKEIRDIKQPPWLKRDALRLIRQKRKAW